MRVMSYNILNGGFDGSDDRRFRSLLGIVGEAAPDVLLIQEARGFLASGCERLFAFERALGLRGFVAEARTTGQNTAVFVRPGIKPLAFTADDAHFHHAAATVRLSVPGLDKPLTAVSVHLCPNGPQVRLRETSYLFGLALPDDYVIVGGDLNSVSPDDAEPEGLPLLPAHHRVRYAAPDGTADRRAVAGLLQAGFVDVATRLAGSVTTTVPAAGFENTEFMPFRSDYLFASEAMARRVRDYAVMKTPATGAASDHYPIVIDFSG
ncbi:MAG TPA: endonuclease/exonuclease/phosphatase family protein [Methylorubrum populi]|jgi:endonuclease/exonuclease/phosphatase family metal-dependent hydrolase|uniref:Endonuclease/exonuclease/phosphatase family protein n=1 Tax=Methylorubrum populi TaxID=223967 RepID=A0A921JDQ6_9HYPH|nr:endonuclease/exonuclease/phosphatase family protein [Methylorubrum populi]